MSVDPVVFQTAGASASAVLDVMRFERRGASFDIEGKFDYTMVESPAEIL
jgi:hypothetical protein